MQPGSFADGGKQGTWPTTYAKQSVCCEKTLHAQQSVCCEKTRLRPICKEKQGQREQPGKKLVRLAATTCLVSILHRADS